MALRTDAYRQFHTNDLYLDENEVGNAFWGYEIANNFERIMGAHGTVSFKDNYYVLGSNGLHAYIAIDKLEFQHAPVIQLWSKLDTTYSTGSAIAVTSQLGGALNEALTPTSANMVVYSAFSQSYLGLIVDVNNNQDRYTLLDGSDEIMRLRPPAYQVPDVSNPGYWYYNFGIDRGLGPTTPTAHTTSEVIYAVSSWTWSVIEQINTFENQPIWVEAYAGPTTLHIRWLHEIGGTVYFRLFGG